MRAMVLSSVARACFVCLVLIARDAECWKNRDVSRQQALAALQKVGQQVSKITQQSVSCKVVAVGDGWGQHHLCDFNITAPCMFWSFGISTDYSFDTQLVAHGCNGHAFDPSISMNPQLSDGLKFFQLAADMLTPEEKVPHFDYASLPLLMKTLHIDELTVLKIDCEGCEYALARDILRSHRQFFEHIDQLAVELHLSDKFLRSEQHVLSLGTLFYLLQQADLKLADAKFSGLDPLDETGALILNPQDILVSRVNLATICCLHVYEDVTSHMLFVLLAAASIWVSSVVKCNEHGTK
ncbi:TPA: hypothetical protein ACH3X3_004900 [Trebouxia sp. C0006]